MKIFWSDAQFRTSIIAQDDDCDYDPLMSVYDQILSWAANRKELVTP